MIKYINRQKTLLATSLVLCGILTCWWIVLFFNYDSKLEFQNLLWAASYQLMALFGFLVGIKISKQWGGLGSIIGRAIISLSVGLLFQVLGQSVFSLYNIFLKIEVPYPSLADIGFFGSIPFYVYGAFLLGKASGGVFSLKYFLNKLKLILIPILLLFLSYYSFLKEYEFEAGTGIRVFFDFGYPFGQALYVSVAILAYVLSAKYLGGIMKNKILLVLSALIVQYISDYNFLYQASRGTWINGGYGDFIYLISYFLMTLSLIYIGNAYKTIETRS